MIKELANSLIDQRVIDISKGFPVADGDEYLQLALDLFKLGVHRIPIIGVRAESSIVTLMLISTDVQEHAQLGEEIDLDPSHIAYLEGYPFNDVDLFLFYLKILTTQREAYQRVGQGSDFYAPPLRREGIKELSSIFANIAVFHNLK